MVGLLNYVCCSGNRKLINLTLNLTFVYPCIVSIIVNDDQQDATILAYLFIPNQLYMFRAMSGTDLDQFRLIHDTSQHQYRWTISDAVNTVKCS